MQRLANFWNGTPPTWLLIAITLAVTLPAVGCIPGIGGFFGGFFGGGGAYGFGGAAAGIGGSGTPGRIDGQGQTVEGVTPHKGYRSANGHWVITNTGKPFTSSGTGR
jgi:hypothetical protein